MESENLSIFENIFETEELPMKHILLTGEVGSGKTELLKQIIGSFLNSGKKVLILNSIDDELRTVVDALKGFSLKYNMELKKELFSTQKLIHVDSTSIDIEKLKEFLIEDSSQWIIVQDEFDEVVYNYEQNEFATRKLELLYYVSEFGRVFDIYNLVALKDIKTATQNIFSQKIIDNSGNLLLLKQSKDSLDILKEQGLITKEQIKQIGNLPKYEAMLLRK